jgi:hypothetical protein
MLNQDPIENLFAVIRQCGAGNIKPNCFQFIFCLKTTVLNNLSSNKSLMKVESWTIYEMFVTKYNVTIT